MNLLIVESPIKARTIRKHLPGGDWQVLASGGHVRDLPSSSLGVYFSGGKNRQVLFDFKEIQARSGYMDRIRQVASSASKVYLGTDPDREGEAIAWHVSRMLGSAGSTAQRVSFNAVTASAIRQSLESPRSINMAVVNASLARRAVDRIIGYRVSPLATAALRGSASDHFYGVGRVSAGVLAILRNQSAKTMFADIRRGYGIQAAYTNGVMASCSRSFLNKTAVSEALGRVGGAGSSHYLTQAKRGSRIIQASPPLTTARMIRSASKLMGWSGEKTMSVAQELYHGGRITYPRTDSVAVSEEGLAIARGYIGETFGPEYLGKNLFEADSPYAQEAHECIRPTQLGPFSSEDEGALLLSVIQAHFIASQMSPAQIECGEYEIRTEGLPFEAKVEKLVFDGHLRMLPDGASLLGVSGPILTTPQPLDLLKASITELREVIPVYDEAALVGDMERLGVGRPSTYASSISNVLKQGYSFRNGSKDKSQDNPGQLPIELDERGDRLIDWLQERFRFLSDLNFSREIEERLDRIARSCSDGLAERDALIRDVYDRVEEAIGQISPRDESPEASVWASFAAWEPSETGTDVLKPARDSSDTDEAAVLGAVQGSGASTKSASLQELSNLAAALLKSSAKNFDSWPQKSSLAATS